MFRPTEGIRAPRTEIKDSATARFTRVEVAEWRRHYDQQRLGIDA